MCVQIQPYWASQLFFDSFKIQMESKEKAGCQGFVTLCGGGPGLCYMGIWSEFSLASQCTAHNAALFVHGPLP